MEDHADIARVLAREVRITEEAARLYVLVATSGAMDAAGAAARLGIGEEEARSAAAVLVRLGGFIDYGGGRFESMHPRFSSVNMYRKSCESRGEAPGRNDAIDNVGSALERDYDRARAKYGRAGGAP